MDDQAKRLLALRAVMLEHDLAAYLVPHADQHQNEYLVPAEERLAWVSGFSGSAGLAIIARDRAALFVDGRYTLQAQDQANPEFWQHLHSSENPCELWLQRALTAGDTVGFDPCLHTPAGLARLRTVLENSGMTLSPVEGNLIDRVWADRPLQPSAPVSLYAEAFAGEASAAKRQRIATLIKEFEGDALVISAPDNLAWMFNIRGTDVEMTPSVFGYAVLKSDASAVLFIEGAKLGADVRVGIEAQGEGRVAILEPQKFEASLAQMNGQKVRVDRATANVFVVNTLKAAGANIDVGADPCTLAKACKNPVQIQGMHTAHHRDGVALVRFLSWLRQRVPGAESEWTLAQKIDGLRAEGKHFRSLSFPTISATGENAAHAHYKVEKATARVLGQDELYLLDSGAQYLDGTTDVTRVTVIGTPTAEMRRRYTQVFKGHIAVSRAHFPEGTTGAQLDPLARQFLWADGVDYDHGTGHGVGSYLSVHEGPQSLSKRGTAVALEPGMVLSIEPGFYKAGAFGIRIENLVVVCEVVPQPQKAEHRTLGFETLTLAPYERRLIDVSALSESERAWVDAYHAHVRETLTPHLNAKDAAFLAEQTAPLMI